MSALVQAARRYKGVPWRHCGRSVTGMDCAGLPWLAYADCGVSLPDRRRYGRDPFNNGLMDAVVEALGDPVWSGEKGACVRSMLQPGDVLVMSPASRPRHLGIVGDDEMHGLSLIHADSTPGVMCVAEIGMDDFFVRQIVCVFRRPV
ncbi:C40 family peptidase [Variovorax sp. GT1P44]|uniref:C40 family peptidase n=1 Tax=Variovorax sp. GT1P44 TaxID=3443742 RepID=UPI003F45050C